jgi:signal peptidase I
MLFGPGRRRRTYVDPQVGGAVIDDEDEDAAADASPETDAARDTDAARELDPAEEAEPKRTRWWIELPLLLLIAVVVTLVVKALLAQAFYIPSGSMEPQLHVNDRVVVSRLAYRLHDPNRGDIVVFPSPIAPQQHHSLVGRVADDVLDALAIGDRGDDELIKRVIGLPGEEVEAHDGVVLIDGKALTEPYLPDGVRTDDFGPVRVPKGRVFVMGDNRGNSHDSRFSDIGTIPIKEIVGRAIAKIWPPGRTSFL